MGGIGTRLHDLMLVPYYARLMYSVEGKIHEFDKDAQEEGICLTDANVKSALLKAIGFARGQSPSFTTKREKDRAIRDLTHLLKRIGDTIEVVAEGEDGVKITERVGNFGLDSRSQGDRGFPENKTSYVWSFSRVSGFP